MKLFKVKLNAYTSPAWVQATSKKRAIELTLENYPYCDCCGEPTKVMWATETREAVPYYTQVITEVVRA